MPFRLPVFPLLCTIWRASAGIPPIGPPIGFSQCNLAQLRSSYQYPPGVPYPFGTMRLLVPAGTDIRGAAGGTNGDVIDCPSGTGRIYSVLLVDDVGKGFLNEHRFAIIAPGLVPGSWPYPTP